MLRAGKIDESTYLKLEDCATPTCGSCSFLGTENTMSCAAEGLGLCLSGSATIPATLVDRFRAARASGRQIVKLFEGGINARKIINRKGIESATRLSSAIGGSTNVALNMPAIGYEADFEVTMDIFEELCKGTPYIAKMNPAAAANVPDFHFAGGVPPVMKEILPLLHRDALTVSGKTVSENVADAVIHNSDIIRTMANPWAIGGGLAVLRGNLAPNTGITKPAAIVPEMRTFSGKAQCFDSDELANQAIINGKVQGGR
jgi:dihydroxy-acid dehydratase